MSANEPMRWSRRTAGVLATLLLGACGADIPVTATDAGVDSGIAPPAPPVLTPCPAGWREVTDAHGLVTCDPWPESGYRTGCAFDEAHFAGTPGCARVGTACAADGWPSDLPSDRAIVYVDDGAAPGGDGASRGTAFQLIRDAVIAAPDGAVIAVATGLYDEAVGLPAGVTLWGACVAGTRLVTSAPSETDAALTFYGEGSGVRNLGIDGVERVGMIAVGVRSVSIDGVVIAGAASVGLGVRGGSVTATDLVVRGTRAVALEVASGQGITVQGGAQVVLSRAVVVDNRSAGVIAGDAGTTLSASDIVVRGTREEASNGEMGRGVAAQGGAHVALSRAVVEDNRLAGLYLFSPGTDMEASDVVVRGTREQAADGEGGAGVMIFADAHLALFRALVEDNRETGIFAGGLHTTVEASEVVVRDTQARALDGSTGDGVWVSEGARVVLTGARIERSHFVGIASVLGAEVRLNDVVVSGVEPSRCVPGLCDGDTGGFGLVAIWGGALEARHFVVEGATLCGLMVGRGEAAASSLDVVSGAIDRSAIGACVQVDGYDTRRLQHGVEYRDVGVPLRATSYELPSELPIGAAP